MTVDEITASARAAGAAGTEWNAWTASDAVQDFCATFEGAYPTEVWEAAFHEGQREYRLAHGWVRRWTTAPVDYDSFGTETISEGGPLYHGKAIRQVIINGEELDYQSMRYGSGLHLCAERDPRELQAEIDAAVAKDAADRQEYESRRVAGLAWLKTLTPDQLEDLKNDDGPFTDGTELRKRALQYADVRAELKAKQDAATAEAQRIEVDRCRSLIPEGCVLIDGGGSGMNRRSPHVYYNIEIDSWTTDPERVGVNSSSGQVPGGTLADVCYRIEKGFLRVAKPTDVPPQKVLDRIGHDRFKDVRTYSIDGISVWVGRKMFASIGDELVLTADGRIVRKQKIRDEATARYRAEEV